VPIPRQARALKPGRGTMRLIASDNQEAKNVNTDSTDLLPNTARRRVTVRVVRAPTVTWIAPEKNACVSGTLDVVASSPAAVSSVGFFVGGRQIGRVRTNVGGVYSFAWNGGAKGARTVTAVVSDSAGREARAVRRLRVCG
jgi:hypothetical protein